MTPLYKSTIVIWSEFDPATIELSALARDAESGDSYCSKHVIQLVNEPSEDPDWDANDFFDCPFL